MGRRLLVVGGDAAGMSAAVLARRMDPDLEVVAVERTRWTSYSAWGIPHLTAGALRTPEELVVRGPDEFRAQRIDVRTGHEVRSVDLAARRAEVHNLTHGRTFHLGFDLLHLATGARPLRPDVDGVQQPHVHGVQTLEDGAGVLDDLRRRRPTTAAVIGGDHVGLSMAVALAQRGLSVTVVHPGPEVVPQLDPEIGARVAQAVRGAGIDVEGGTAVTAVGEETITTSSGREVPAGLVILGLGSAPETDVASAAGIAVGPTGGLSVDRRQQTSVAGVWAAGDCCEAVHLLTGRPTHHPLATSANRQGRVAGTNLAGGYATFPGVLGTFVASVSGLEVGRTGLGEEEARLAGYEVAVAAIDSATAEPYVPGAGPVSVKLVAERVTGRLLGAQTIGAPGSAKRVDTVAAALAGRLTVEDLLGLDLATGPSFSGPWEPLQVAARVLVRDV